MERKDAETIAERYQAGYRRAPQSTMSSWDGQTRVSGQKTKQSVM